MKKVFFTTLIAAGFLLASCGSNKTEGNASGDSTAVDSAGTSTGTVSTPTDTMSTTTDSVAPINDTVQPAP